jgi:NAD(P)H dehydrogenase (quinone)
MYALSSIMDILVIFAHPKTNGFCSYTLESVLRNLKSKKIQFEVLDLYDNDYSPLLKENELYTAGNREIDGKNIEIQKKISDCDFLIFIYPVWWNTMPAILKGFFDRVFTPGFAFRFNSFGLPSKLLKGKKALVYMSLGSPNKLATIFFLGDRAKKIIKHDILGYVGFKTKVFQTHNAKNLDEKGKNEIDKKVEKGLNWLTK